MIGFNISLKEQKYKFTHSESHQSSVAIFILLLLVPMTLLSQRTIEFKLTDFL
jgi:hypothetical protein